MLRINLFFGGDLQKQIKCTQLKVKYGALQSKFIRSLSQIYNPALIHMKLLV